jgi:NAD/NADP transhydrogenase beta subunit
MAASEPDGSVKLSWIVIFLLLSLGLGAAAVLAVGGDILPVVAPLD